MLVLELWIKMALTNNIVSFSKFNIFAFFNDFLVDDVIHEVKSPDLDFDIDFDLASFALYFLFSF